MYKATVSTWSKDEDFIMPMSDLYLAGILP